METDRLLDAVEPSSPSLSSSPPPPPPPPPLSSLPSPSLSSSSSSPPLPPPLPPSTLSSSVEQSECRICQEEDAIVNLEVPCTCSGSLKFAHRKCVQRWCNEKGNTICEICHQPYQSGYTAPAQPVHREDITIDLSEEWDIHVSRPFELRDPRMLAMAAAQRHLLESEQSNYAQVNFSGVACFRSVALILMFLLLLRHVLSMAVSSGDGDDDDDDASMFFTIFLLRTAGLLLPCYIMIRAINMLQRRRQQQEAAMAAAEVAVLLQAGQVQGMHFTLVPGPSLPQELV